MLDIWHQASLIAHSFLREEFFTEERREITERWLPMAETMVYETDGRVFGFLALISNEVGAIFVDPDSQGHGIGRAVMDRVLLAPGNGGMAHNTCAERPIGARRRGSLIAGYLQKRFSANMLDSEIRQRRR